MLLLNDPPLLFIHIPRTAGKSIGAVMNQRGETWRGRIHEHLEMFVEREGEETFRNYTSFCIVRHPLTRFLSQYRFMRAEIEKFPFMNEIANIPEFIDAILAAKPVEALRPKKGIIIKTTLARIMRPLGDYTRLGSTPVAVTHVFRFEDLPDAWGKMCDTLGLPHTPLPITHRTEPSPPADIAAAEPFVANYYEQDFAAFGYE